MGKASKLKLSKKPRNVPLDQQISEDTFTRPSKRNKVRERQDEDQTYVDDKLTRKILEQAKQQQEDLEEEHGFGKMKGKKVFQTKLDNVQEDEEESSDDELELDDDNFYEHVEIKEEDERALEMFMNDNAPARRTLADIIQEKLAERETEIRSQLSAGESIKMVDLDEKVIEMYRGVKQVLKQYRSGKLPKAFKIIPSLSNWEQVLYLTEPESWSAAAVYQATRIFASNLKDKMAQRFYNLVLLPRVRDDIAEYKRLNFHLYQALRKALFKPGAFFKGIILPLCESGTCTLREAIILSSVLVKNSVPVLHASAAMLKIAEMDYSGANSIFLRVLLDKKYTLPFRVVDAVVYHFLRFATDKRELPVLWHQCFLTFVQHYKEDISSEQKEALLDLLKSHSHPKITYEIRRELQNSKSRDVMMAETNE